MVSKKLFVVGAALAALIVITTIGAKAASPYDWAAGLPGCDSSRPAVAHHAGQAVLSPQPPGGPVPCGTSTGWPTVETRIEATSGAVIQEPALLSAFPVDGGSGHFFGLGGRGFGLARTLNNGGKWDAVSVVVPPDLIVEEGGVDSNLYVDHSTNRLFFYMYSNQYAGPPKCIVPGGNPATVAFSDDNGTTWNVGFDIDHGCSENPTILTGKPTISDLSDSSYPDVVYLCGDNTSSGAGAVGNPGFSCSKSLDGGAHWLGSEVQGTLPLQGQGFYSGPVKDATAPYSQCNGQSSSAGADVQPLMNGTLAVVVSCNSNFFLSESKDEGATWNIVHQLPTSVAAGSGGLGGGGTFRVDSANNMYLLNVVNGTSALPGGSSSSGNSELLLSHSTNGGATWSTPLNMIAPGVTSVGTFNFAQGTFDDGLVGNIAVTYYGINPKSPDGKNGYSDGYITATKDALDPDPVFWSGQVNPDGHPLLYNTSTDGNIGITILDFNGGAWSPNGQSVWGSWVQDCGSNIATSPGCTSRYPAINPADPENGFAGRLVWPSHPSPNP